MLSSCVDINALSYGLDHHILTKANRNAVTTEFKHFFQNLLKDIAKFRNVDLHRLKLNLKIHVKNSAICQRTQTSKECY